MKEKTIHSQPPVKKSFTKMCVAVGDGGPEETPKKASTTQRQETVDPQCEGADTEEIVRLPVDKDVSRSGRFQSQD